MSPVNNGIRYREIVIHDIPIGELCGPQVELVVDRCQQLGNSWHRDIGDPGSKEFVHLELANPVAPTE
jgi:hypothetical protein